MTLDRSAVIARADVGDAAIPTWRRRRDLIAVLNPRAGELPSPAVQYAADQALAFGWNVRPVADNGVCAVTSTNTIETTPIFGDKELATFMHEGGHLEDREVRRRSPFGPVNRIVSIAGEVFAWDFARRRLGYRWNQAMHAALVQSLWSYRQGGHHLIDPVTERAAFDTVVAASAEQARHVVRMRSADGR